MERVGLLEDPFSRHGKRIFYMTNLSGRQPHVCIT